MIVVLTLTIILLVGCGGETISGNVVSEPIKIGVMTMTTGDVAFLGQANRLLGLDHDHRVGAGYPECEYHDHQSGRSLRAVPIVSIERPRGTLQPAGLCLSDRAAVAIPQSFSPKEAARHRGVFGSGIGVQGRDARSGDPGRGQYLRDGATRIYDGRRVRSILSALGGGRAGIEGTAGTSGGSRLRFQAGTED